MNLIDNEEMKLAGQCLEMALSKGADQVRISLSKSVMNLVGTLNGEIDKVTHCFDRSMSFNLFVDNKYGSFSTNRLEIDEIDRFLDEAVATVRMLETDSHRALPDPERTEKNAITGQELGICDDAYNSITPETRLSTALQASIFKEIGEHDEWKIISEETEYSDNVNDLLIIDSNGLKCRHSETSFDFMADMAIEDAEGNKYSGYWWDSYPFSGKLDCKSCCRKALERSIAQIHPEKCAGGKYNMVLDPDVSFKVASPVLSALNAFSIQQNNSFLMESLGKRLFPEGLTILDDCRTAGQSGCKMFDSEGVATRTDAVIEDGVIKKYFLNTYMASKMGMEPTIEDATRPRIMPWPEPGLDREKILGICGDGILVTGFNGGNCNSATGDFSYGVEGFAFKDGKITHPVHEMLITGNFLTLWNGLIAAGDDFRPCMSKLIPTLAFRDVNFSA